MKTIDRVKVVVIGAVMMGGCFSPGTMEENEAQMSFGLTGGDFYGNSVRICGRRLQPADTKYACDSVLSPETSTVAVPGPHAGEECPCYDFAADGTLKDPTTHQAIEVNSLCPSIDLPHANWRFDYTIYTRQACAGQVLNTPANNFTCFDSQDLASQDYPNASVEYLVRGDNENHVLCTTENASKSWDFESCSIETTAQDEQLCQERYDCGCTVYNGVCSCGSLHPSDLEIGCHFEQGTCDIICSDGPST